MKKPNSFPETLKPSAERKLSEELEPIKNEMDIGCEVIVKRLPGTIKFKNGKPTLGRSHKQHNTHLRKQ